MEEQAQRILNKIQTTTKKESDTGDVSNAGVQIIVYYLGRWTASIYSLIWLDLLIWIILYTIISLIYRLVLNDDQKSQFEDLIVQVGFWSARLPVTFLLGFFVSNVVSRWWSIFLSIPKMAGAAAIITGCIRSKTNTEEAAQIRITMTRYLNLAWILALWEFCGPLQNRFDMIYRLAHHFKGILSVDQEGKIVAKKMTANELKESEIETKNSNKYAKKEESMDEDGPSNTRIHNQSENPTKCLGVKEKLELLNKDPIIQQYYGYMMSKSEIKVFERRAAKKTKQYSVEWWIPLFWALALADEALSGGYIRDTNTLVQVQGVVYNWYSKLRLLINYAKRNLPLVYIQVVIVAVYTVYLTELLVSQFVIQERSKNRNLKEGYIVDYYVPVLTIINLMFVLGWFKVAMVLLDPFGNDVEDFPFSAILNGNIKSGTAQAANNPLLYPRHLRGAITNTHAKTGTDTILANGNDDDSSNDETDEISSQIGATSRDNSTRQRTLNKLPNTYMENELAKDNASFEIMDQSV